MGLSQLIYTSTCTDAMTPKKAYDMSCLSISVCDQLGLTGRVFANNQEALAMTEGPTELVKMYFAAVRSDPLVETILLHVDRPIERREFDDYSVWLNLSEPFSECEKVFMLTPDSMKLALPKTPSSRLRIMAEAYLSPLFAAA